MKNKKQTLAELEHFEKHDLPTLSKLEQLEVKLMQTSKNPMVGPIILLLILEKLPSVSIESIIQALTTNTYDWYSDEQKTWLHSENIINYQAVVLMTALALGEIETNEVITEISNGEFASVRTLNKPVSSSSFPTSINTTN